MTNDEENKTELKSKEIEAFETEICIECNKPFKMTLNVDGDAICQICVSEMPSTP